MKAIYQLFAMLVMMSLASCSAESSDPVENSTSTNSLEKTFGARSVAYDENNSDNLSLSNLPAISASEANDILSTLRKHTNVKETQDIDATTRADQTQLTITTQQTVNGKYTFTIQLNMISYSDGSLYYKGYNAYTSSTLFKWYLKGFGLSSNGSTGNYKFECTSYLYFKVADDGIRYLEVPISVKGTYNPSTHDASFTYTL
ncbi:DUF5033 domain-containing protein [Phocaeicola sp.]